MIATGIITAPRPNATLCASYDSFRNAGFRQPVYIFAEPGVEDIPRVVSTEVRIIQNDQRKGNLRNWVHAALTLLQATIDPFVMICEDDIRWVPWASEHLYYELQNSLQWGAAGALSLYCPDRMAGMIGKAPLSRGYHHVSVGFKMWGAQCLLFRRHDLHSVLISPFFESILDNPKNDKNIDGWIAETLARHGRTILYRIPCLVDHEMGDRNSSIYGDKVRPTLGSSHVERKP